MYATGVQAQNSIFQNSWLHVLAEDSQKIRGFVAYSLVAIFVCVYDKGGHAYEYLVSLPTRCLKVIRSGYGTVVESKTTLVLISHRVS